MNKPCSVVFDLDGTLVDSTGDITLALNTTLASHGGRLLQRSEVAPLIGEGVAALIIGAAQVSGLVDPDTDAMAAEYLDSYRARPVVASTLYPAVKEALTHLAGADVPMGVCTNKAEGIARVVLDRLDIGHCFRAVVGGDRIERRKPEPEHLWLALNELQHTDAATAVLVGDSVVDQRCAEAAGVRFLVVPWAPQDVEGERFQTFADLPAIVAALCRPEPRPELAGWVPSALHGPGRASAGARIDGSYR